MGKLMTILKSAPFVVFLGMSLAGCSTESPEEAACHKLAECGELPKGQTEQQCADEGRDALDHAREKQGCAPVVDKFRALLSCEAELSCKDLTAEIDPEATKDLPCNDEFNALSDAIAANPACASALSAFVAESSAP
jgi:hypothetical protein